MKHLRAILISAAPAAALIAACAHGGSTGSGTGASSGAGGAAVACPPCTQDSDCASGQKCGQFGGDQYCAPDCSTQACSPDRTCMMISGANGDQDQLCIPNSNVCGAMPTGAGGATTSSSSTSSSGNPNVCGSLIGPAMMANCASCTKGASGCQANGCYGGWWCNMDTNKCQAPPSPSSCPGGTTSSSSSSTSSTSTSSGSSGPIGPMGGTIPALSFAIVGDTRPANEDDTAHYPTAIITKIWQDVEALNPRPAFGISTGDYMFANPYGSQSGAQMALYLGARASFTNIVFPAMGNHECTGGVASNCGQGSVNGTTNNYNTFMTKMLQPLGQSLPYYAININGTNNAWTSKFIFVACNAWNSTQQSWLSGELAKPTTYTFVVRHEGTIANTAPCVTPVDSMLASAKYTLLIVGHTHTFSYYPSEKQVVVGNGGAPLTGSINYGYVVGQQQSNGTILFHDYDYSTNASVQTFTVAP